MAEQNERAVKADVSTGVEGTGAGELMRVKRENEILFKDVQDPVLVPWQYQVCACRELRHL